MIFAVVPAGGKSSRMGRPKLELPYRGRTVLECVLDALRLGGCDETVVVLGAQAAPLEATARQAGAHVCLLAEETADMRATVEVGLAWLEQRFRPRDADAWFLVPADQPTLDPDIVAALRLTWLAQTDKSIVVAAFAGKRGHPVLLSWKHVDGVRRHTPGKGLNTYLSQHQAATVELPLKNASVLTDLDTPEDYAKLVE
jgi:molybdenum cofactor cytidylyltransferase